MRRWRTRRGHAAGPGRRLARASSEPPLGVSVDADEKQSDRYILYLSQSGLGLPDRDFYLVDNPKYHEIRAKYVDYLTLMLTKAGYADARAKAQAVFALETAMAREMWDRGLQRNRDLTYSKLSRTALEGLGSRGMVGTFIEQLGAGRS